MRYSETVDKRQFKWKKSWSVIVSIPLLFFFSACQIQQVISDPLAISSKPLPVDISAKHFLAARQASYLNDVTASAEFFLDTLERDKNNPELLKLSFETQYRDGNINMAAALAGQLEGTNIKAPYTSEPAIAQSIKATDWDAVIVLSDQLAEDVTAAPLARVIKSWAFVATGRGDAGLAHLSKTGQLSMHKNNTIPPHIQLQFALLTEYLGHREEAVLAATQLTQSQELSPKIALQTAGILMRNQQDVQAGIILDNLPYSFDRNQINSLQLVPPENEVAHIANAIVDTATAYHDPQFVSMLPARLQLALYLDPENNAGKFFLAQSWFRLGRFERAKRVLSSINNSSPWALPGRLLQNNVEIKTGNIDKAINHFNEYVERHPNNAYLHKELGDLYRRHEQYEKARNSYLESKARGFDTANLYRNLAISHERLEEDHQAEASFKAALERNPNDPFTLNYLGYWWAESGLHLDQAIRLIEKAVRLQPNSGFFVDSLGWVHYQLGNYQVAVEFLEKATTLEPEDALIISHLGDAYWKTGRHNEAEFKWRYAALLTTDNNLHADLQTKLTSGLSSMGQ